MFRSEGLERSDRLNRIVAGYLAFIGGYVNMAGFVLLGALTSHVTGNVGRAALDLSKGQLEGAWSAALLVVTFFLGALGPSLVLESARLGHTSRRYGIALAIEAALLSVFLGLHQESRNLALLLSAAMGLQNSLVTRLSGAIVRTTHLTGVVTDLGIEAARWLRWSRDRDPERRPPMAKVALLATIGVAFTTGAVAGSASAIAFAPSGKTALAFPIVALGAGAIYALRSKDR